MVSFINLLTNREIAILIWLTILLVAILSQKNVRSSVFDLLKALFAIFPSIATMLLYVFLIVLVLYFDGFWDVTLLKDTILWVIGGAFIMLYNSSKVMADERYLKHILLQNLTMFIIVEYIISQYVFALWFELLLIPVLTILGALQAVAGADEKNIVVKRFLDGLLGVIGILLILHAVYGVVLDIKGFATSDTLRSIMLAPILSLTFLPFFYGFVLWMKYGMVFVRCKVFTDNASLLRYAKWRIFLACGLSLQNINVWSQNMGALHLESRDDVRRRIQLFKTSKEAV